MPLTADEAARIARRHGLTLQDAAGLLSLATDPDAAELIAARFASPDVDLAMRGAVRNLFGERRELDHATTGAPEPEDAA